MTDGIIRGYGRQPRNLAELLADLTRRDRGGDLETRSDSSKSSVAEAAILPSAPIVVPGGIINPVAGRPAAPVISIPGFGTVPSNGIPAAPTAPLLPLPRPSRAPSASPQPSRPPVAPSQSPRPSASSLPPSQPAAPSSQPPRQPATPSSPPPRDSATPSSPPPRQPTAPPSQPPRESPTPSSPPPRDAATPSSPPPRQPTAPSSPPPRESPTPSSPPSRQPEPTRPPVMAPVQPSLPPTENVPVTSQIPFSSMLPSSNAPVAPSETDGAVASPGREASMDGRSANNGSRQIAILASSIVGAMLLAGLVAMFCIRKNKKERKAREAHAGALPKHAKAGSISGSISYPVQEGGSSGPWTPPLRKPTDATPRAAPVAAAAWPMGQTNSRNSMESGSLDDKQYLAYQNLVGNAENQITPPPAVAQGPASRMPGSRDTRYLSASSADPYEQINGRYSEWPAMPSVPNPDGGGNAQNQVTVPIGYAQTTAAQPPQQPRNMDQYAQTARINQHYSAAERQMFAPSYHQPGVQRASVAPPSPLFFKLDNQGNLGPESRR
ncbi:hypothetical protein PpBr36_04042 [Pyricularia pennisetigena]|uniref:hypothetical protein n=1 Tax=Pyricularia pennisetigena TaxID=1578925 RepID=UPI00114DF78E|nr:hypothetical protein PpBr36_04042 [Pyricularia pennisetigena]TLS27487.1 hypothetical protein PpBr36_04042 [Pyricularia pennisetigena]